MTKNLLNKETSPYLLQHKDNPVNWYPWSEEAFKKAKSENKPVLLSVGYAACHWCHVMAHESFEDEETAKLMNREFINIKLDREERPDLDSIYQNALALLGQQGGWPLTMFLSSNKKPFWGGTYFPKEPKYGMPAFKDVLTSIAKSYASDQDAIIKNQTLIFKALSKLDTSNPIETNIEKFIVAAKNNIIENCDLRHGGLNGAPKFPQLFIYDFLLNLYQQDQDKKKLNIITSTLDNICSGGIFDHVAGGISRYSVDELWLVPHFEKMLYDNAQLLLLLNKFYITTHQSAYKQKAEQIANWIISEMQDKDGGYYAALDADSEGVEGKFYIWSYVELKNILKDDLKFFCSIFNVTEEGNWEGNIILSRYKQLHINEEEEARVQLLLDKLAQYRKKRIKPQLDDKILVDWNGLTIEAMAYTGKVLNNNKYLKSAERAFSFIFDKMFVQNKLYHSNCMGINKHLGMLDDYVHLTKAALMLYETTSKYYYLEQSILLTKCILDYFFNKSGGFYTNSDDQKDVILKNIQYFDNVTPNSNAVLLSIFSKISLVTSDKKYVQLYEDLISKISKKISNQYLSSTSFLKNYNLIKTAKLLIIAGKNKDQNEIIYQRIYEHYLDNIMIIIIDKKSELDVKFSFYKDINVEDQTLIYICKDNTCSLPFTDVNLLKKYL
ncbi:MAG: thioredoxin domain-containing protein [Pelagibacterales bacterium]|nr:thioredoxin domain-containing protein [Pelagibacterales bacterium]